MNGMQNIFGQHYAGLNPQSNGNGYTHDDNNASLDANMMQHGPTQTIDQMINQNNQEMLRRRQTYQPTHHPEPPRDHTRRSSMLEFSSNGSGELADFQFDPNPQHAVLSNHVANMNIMYPQKGLDPRRVRSRDDLSLDTDFSSMRNYDAPMSAYPASMIPNSAMSMDVSSGFLPQNMDYHQDFDAASTNSAQMNVNSNQMQQQPRAQQHQQQQQQNPQQGMYTTSPVTANFPIDFQPVGHDSSGGNTSPASNQMSRTNPGNASGMQSPQKYMGKLQSHIRRQPAMPSPLSLSTQTPMQSSGQTPPMHMSQAANSTLQQGQASSQKPGSRRTSMEMQSPYMNQQQNTEMQAEMAGQNNVPPQIPKSRWSNAYSTTGFDMLAVLMRVATRPNPQINIGPVDLACAFVVCDIQKHDLPIMYCSDMFERLTGYSRHEILGRNCRFLQAPDGKVQSGVKRKYVDDKSILYLKNQINRRAEAQLSLINYRKGGQPFMNLLTMIPITWDTDEYKYFVGFQVDLVEQPNSVSAKNPDGTYEINYNRSALPAYRLPDPPNPNTALEIGGQTIARDEVSQVLATIGNGETDLSRRIWDKVLLENTDDVVHVLSLKGLFLYLSPACKTILEYEPSELVGMALSALCHPSDIVPVTRELKDSSNGSSVNVVYRIRRKNSGYTWFESHGSLHTEQGKGRKCIILVGRQRPVYALDRTQITINEGAGDAELWTKISTSGMFLYVSSSSRSMLDRLPDDLVGTSMQALMRPESRIDFGRVLEVARTGEKTTFKHDMQNRRGQVLQAQTTVYPGDAREGSKPTFLLTQTRLLKMTRAMLLTQRGNASVSRSDISMGSGTPMSNAPMNSPPQLNRQEPLASLTQIAGMGGFGADSGILTQAGSGGAALGSQDEALASEDNIFDELKTTRSTSWQFELRQMEKQNRLLSEELQTLLSRKKKRKRRKGMGNLEKDCANCHTRVTPEWRRGPSGQRDLCNSCGLRWAKLNGRVSPRKSGMSEKSSTSPVHASSGQLQSTSNASGSKESSAETKPTPSSIGNSGQMNEGKKMPTSLRQSQMKQEGDDREMGSMPPVIEEGQESPHPKVLPT